MSGKFIFVDEETAEAIALGARFCRTLTSVERAYMIEDTADFQGILDNVDPIDAMLAANLLQALRMAWEILPAAPDVGSDKGDERSPLRAVTDAPLQASTEPTDFSIKA